MCVKRKKKAEPKIKNGCQIEKKSKTKYKKRVSDKKNTVQKKQKKTEPVTYFRCCRPFVVCVVRGAMSLVHGGVAVVVLETRVRRRRRQTCRWWCCCRRARD